MQMIGQHEHVIKMYGCNTTVSPFSIVLELAPLGDLRTYMKRMRQNVSVRKISLSAEFFVPCVSIKVRQKSDKIDKS